MSNHPDERVIATRQRWAARGLVILSIALSLDLIVRALILKQEPWQYLDIGLIWMATTGYVALGMAASGVELYEGKLSKNWLVMLIIAVEVPVVLTLMGMVHTLAAFIAEVALAAAGAFVTLIILRGIYRVWERRTLGRGSREE